MTMDRTVYGSRGKLTILLLVSLLFVAVGVLMAARPGQSMSDLLIAWGVLSFFGLGALVFAYQLLRPSRLDLTATGFTYTGLFGKNFTVVWADVDAFHIWQNPVAAQRLVAWSYVPGRAPRGAAISRSLGAEGSIPGVWTMSTEDLVTLLQDRLEASRQ